MSANNASCRLADVFRSSRVLVPRLPSNERVPHAVHRAVGHSAARPVNGAGVLEADLASSIEHVLVLCILGEWLGLEELHCRVDHPQRLVWPDARRLPAFTGIVPTAGDELTVLLAQGDNCEGLAGGGAGEREGGYGDRLSCSFIRTF